MVVSQSDPDASVDSFSGQFSVPSGQFSPSNFSEHVRDLCWVPGAVVSAVSAKHVNDFEIAARELPARSLMMPAGIDTV